MGQGASQPSDKEGFHNESPDDSKMNGKKSHRKSLKAFKKGKSHAKSTDESATKRKRKSGDHDKNSVAPVPTASSPRDEQSSRPVKRKKTREEDSTEIETPKSDGRKVDKAAPKTKEQPTTKSPAMVRSPAEDKHHVSPNRVHKSEVAPSPENEEKATSDSEQDSGDEQKEDIPMSGSPAPEGIRRQRTRRRESNRYSEKGHLVGHFHPEEIQQIEKFKIEFCNTHAIEGSEFDDMIQHAVREKEIPFPNADILPKQEFWQSIYEVLPKRDRRSVYRFMRRHFQSSEQKPHVWTHEQDDELVELFEEHGPKFAYIANLLGRNDDDVVQRWKNRLQHRSTMNRGPWTDDEATELRDAIQEAWNRLKANGEDVGADIYEMDEKMLAWGAISDRLQNRRSRQQCGDKWRKTRRKVLLGRGQRGRGASGAAKEIQQQSDKDSKNCLSSPYVNSSDDDDDDDRNESLGDDKAKPGRSDSDEGRSPAQEEEKNVPAPSFISKSVLKPDAGANSDSETGESGSDSESGSDNSSSDSDEEEEEGESHTSTEPNALQSTQQTQLGEQKRRESKPEMANGPSQRDITKEQPTEKANNAQSAPNKDKHTSQDRDSSSGSSSEGEDDDSEDDKSESSAHSHGSPQTKSQNGKAQPQPSDEKSNSASSGESESEGESEDEDESDMDLDIPPKREPEKPTKPTKPPSKEEANTKPRLSLLKQLKQDLKPQKPSPFIKAPAPAKDSSSSSDETESSSDSSSDNSSESEGEDDGPSKPAQKGSPAKNKAQSQNPPVKIPPLIGRSPSLPAPKPAPKDIESNDESGSSSSSDGESDSEKESKPTGPPKKELQGQGHPVKRRSISAPETDSEGSESEPETKKPKPTASTPNRSVDQGSKRKRSSTSTSAPSATRNTKGEAASPSESDAKRPGEKSKVQR